MKEEELEELRQYNLEYLEALDNENLYDEDYTSAVELKYAKKEIERLNNKIKEQNLLLIEFQDMEQRLKEKDNIIDEAIERLTLNGDIQEKDVIEVFANAIRDTRNILNGEYEER